MLPFIVKIMFSPLSSGAASGGGMIDKLKTELDERLNLEKLEADGKLTPKHKERLAELRAQDKNDKVVDELTRGPGNTGTGV